MSQIWSTVTGYEELAGKYLQPIRNAEVFELIRVFCSSLLGETSAGNASL